MNITSESASMIQKKVKILLKRVTFLDMLCSVKSATMVVLSL